MAAAALSQAPAVLHAQATPTPPPTQQQPAGDSTTFTIKAYSRLTLVDVLVFDAKENPVHGLPQSAFTVMEDGKPQPLRSFTEVTSSSTAPPAPPRKLPPHIYTNLQPAPVTSAVNVLLLDSLNTATGDQVFMKDETVKFLKSMQPGTRVAIMGLSSKLRLLQGFTSDPELLIAAVSTKKNRSLPSPFTENDTSDAIDQMMDVASDDAAAQLQQFENEQASFQADIKNRMTLEALNEIAAYLAGIKGRKNLIWFTSGIPLQMFPQGGANDMASMTDYTKDVRHTTDLLTTEQIAVYPVDAGGLTTSSAASVITPPKGFANGHGDSMGTALAADGMKNAQAHLGMEAFAEATGGIAYYNTNGLKEAVGKAIQNGESYYSLSYTPPDPKFDGLFHTIRVKVNVPGVHLSYRKGYYSDDIARNEITPGVSLSATAPEPYGNNMQASMGRGVPTSSQLLFTARVEPHSDAMNAPGDKVMSNLDPKLQGKPLRRYDFQYSIPGRQLTFNDGPNSTHKGSIEFDIAAYDVYGKVITSTSQTINLSLTEDRYKLLQTKPFQLLQGLDLPPGEMFVRIGVLDATSDKTGTMEIPLEVTRKPAPSTAASAAGPHP